MKIWHKILTGFLLVIVLVSLSGVVTSWNYEKIIESFQKIVNRDMAAIETAEEMERLLLEMDAWIQSYQHTKNPALLKQFQDANKRWLSFMEDLHGFVDDDPAIRKSLSALNEVSLGWMQTVERTIKADRAPASTPSLNAARSLYRDFLMEQRARLYQSHNASLKTVERADEITWALRAIAVLVGIAACILVIRSVKRPLDQLTLATESVAAGKFAPVPQFSNDELGKLTVAFNEMSSSLQERTAALEEQRRLAVQSNELKTEFLANTSHELRTPLNTIMGYSQLILDGLARSPEEQRNYLLTIQQSSKSLLSLINDVLDIARIEAGQMSLDLEPVLVKNIFHRVAEHMLLPARNKGLTLEFSPTTSSLSVLANPDRLSQVLLNLIGNAVKFTPSGKVTVEALSDISGNRVRFIVTDTGIGIPHDRQARLFQKFVQADGSMTRHFGGTGIGLALSKTLLEMMGGDIELHSDGEGMGTSVKFTLPLKSV